MRTRMMRAIVVLSAVVAGCGYHLPGGAPIVPATAHTITIKLFGNRTREHGIEVALRRAIEEEFRRRGGLEVVEQDGDLVLTGAVRRFATIPVAFVGTSEAVQFQGIMQVGFRLVERATGRLVFENKLLQESLDFGTVSQVTVASSPSFQRDTIDLRDLANMTSSQLNDTRRRVTLNDLVDVVAREVYVQSVEGF
jgi:lipopolysaccharide assembly LptE-like protein